MKRIIALAAALIMALTLTSCFGTGMGNSAGTATADQGSAAEVASYDKDFEGLQKYITDRNANSEKQEIFYDIVGADNGVRYVFNKNAYVEIYDFSSMKNDVAKNIIADIKDDGKFRPIEDGTQMNGAVTDSGKYVLAWDSTRGYDYDNKVATAELLENW